MRVSHSYHLEMRYADLFDDDVTGNKMCQLLKCPNELMNHHIHQIAYEEYQSPLLHFICYRG